jgi:dTDP-4-dehydrorhamnose reductase
MRVMILGAGGMLGHDLVAMAPRSATLFPFTKADLDITTATSLAAAVADVRPGVIINAAAYTAVDQAESEVELCFRVNTDAVKELGRIAARARAQVMHFSTDYVFDGTAAEAYTEETSPNPVNVYGASKLAGEKALRASGATFVILRTQWLFGLWGRSFPRTMWERATAGTPSRVVSDQIGRPTYSVDLARAAWRVVASSVHGVLHVANAGTATWYDVAKRVYSATHAEHLVQPCSTEQFFTPARRPAWSVLSTARLEQALGGPLPTWEDGIDRFLAHVQTSAGASRVER